MDWTQVAVAGVQAGAQVSQGLLNNFMVGKTNEENWKRQDRLNRQNIELYHYDNEYNSPAAQMARMRAAGLNPGLMYGGSGSVATSTTPPDMQTTTDIAPQISGLAAIGDALAVARQKAEIDNINAGTQKTKEETKEKELDNAIHGMNNKAFESAYSEGLVHSAVKAGFGKQIDDARMSRYTLFESAWNFAILTGMNYRDSLSSSDYLNVDERDISGKSVVPFDFTDSAFKRAQSLYVGGTEAQIEANKAAKLVATLQQEQKEKDVDIWSWLNEKSHSDKWYESVPATIGLIGLWIAEQRFSMPSFNFNIDKGDKTLVFPKKE